MELAVAAHGIDTMRVRYLAPLGILLHPDGRGGLAERGWRVTTFQERDASTDEVKTSHAAFYQDPELGTIRAGLHTSSPYLWTEFSAPKVYRESNLNLDLCSPAEARDAASKVYGIVSRVLPELDVDDTPESYRRVDYALDIEAGDARAAVISAAASFVRKRARVVTPQMYPGQTTKFQGSGWALRAYDKAAEIVANAKLLSVGEKAAARHAQERGRVRIEMADTRQGGISLAALPEQPRRFAKFLEDGLNGGVVYVAGLERIVQQLKTMKIPEQRKDALISFATQWATIGTDGMMVTMKKPTFYRKRAYFLAAGLRLDDLVSYQGEIDLRPALRLVKRAV